MARVRSTRYPELYISDLDVQFRGGVADVRAKGKLDALAGMDGIEIDSKTDSDQSGDGTTGSGDGATGSGDGGQSDATTGNDDSK